MLPQNKAKRDCEFHVEFAQKIGLIKAIQTQIFAINFMQIVISNSNTMLDVV